MFPGCTFRENTSVEWIGVRLPLSPRSGLNRPPISWSGNYRKITSIITVVVTGLPFKGSRLGIQFRTAAIKPLSRYFALPTSA